MPSNLVVRSTAEPDLTGITAIYTQAFKTGQGVFELQAPDATEMTRRWRMRVAKGYPHVVATSDGAVIGYASARRHRAGLAHRFLVEDSVYVGQDAQGVGVGRALLTELIRLCEPHFRQMVAAIEPENSSSIRLHARLGFREVGRIEGFAYRHGRWTDTLLMQRELGEGNRTSPSDDH